MENRGRKKQEWIISDQSLIERAKEGYSVSEMSKMYEVNYNTIYSRITKLGIQVSKKCKKYKIDKNWLINQLKTKKQIDIAKELGTNYETLRRLLKRLGLYDYARSLSKNRKRRRRYEIDKQEFINLIEKRKTAKQIQTALKLNDEEFERYLVRYQLRRMVREAEMKTQSTRLIQEIKKLLEEGYSIQKIADLVQKKHYQVGYIVRRYIKPCKEVIEENLNQPVKK